MDFNGIVFGYSIPDENLSVAVCFVNPEVPERGCIHAAWSSDTYHISVFAYCKPGHDPMKTGSWDIMDYVNRTDQEKMRHMIVQVWEANRFAQLAANTPKVVR